MESEYLKQYLDNVDFSQNLISRQDEIDKSLIEYVNEKWEVQRVKFNEGDRNRELEKWNYLKINIINIIKLTNLRLRAGMTPSTKKNHAQEDNLKDFKKIINTAKKMVANWNGKFYFLEIPSHSKVKGKIAEDQFSYDVLQIVKELDIPIIDLYSMGFKGKKEVDSLYSRKHFTAKGYRLVAETIAKRLKSDGFLPSKD